MSAVAVFCPRCMAPLKDIALAREEFARCPRCLSAIEMEIFPALFRPQAQTPEAERILIEGESTCFYHADRKALLPCHRCGRFLCALCDCELQGEHFCPSCLEAGVTKGKIRSLENRRIRHDSIALILALAPMLFFYITLVTAPATLYIVIRHWNTPLSVVRRTKVRFVIAAVVALLQIIGWIAVIFLLIVAISGRTNL
jgi:hypothetical protein